MWSNHIIQVHWEPTDKCNSACPMCPRYTFEGFELPTLSNVEWTLESFKAAWPVEFIQRIEKILACGNYGDPCACKEFSDIYTYVREINPKIRLCLNTNASLRNTDWWIKLAKVVDHDSVQGNYCTFSIDGLEDTNHLYRRNTNWKKIMENAKAFIDAGGVAHWDFIVFEHNEHQVEEARELARSMGFKNFNVKRTTRFHKYVDGTGVHPVMWKGKHIYDIKQASEAKFKENFEDSTYFKQSKYQSFRPEDFNKIVGATNLSRKLVGGEMKTVRLNDLSIGCRSVKGARPDASYDEIFISANGLVAPCCYLGSEPHKVGSTSWVDENYMKMVELNGGIDTIDIHKHNLYDILQTDLFQKFIPASWNDNKSMMPAKCGQCCGLEFNIIDAGETGDKRNSYFEEK
jgi:MoaA/NifB/PqqE/SkfB family radical SAM enzyme